MKKMHCQVRFSSRECKALDDLIMLARVHRVKIVLKNMCRYIKVCKYVNVHTSTSFFYKLIQQPIYRSLTSVKQTLIQPPTDIHTPQIF